MTANSNHIRVASYSYQFGKKIRHLTVPSVDKGVESQMLLHLYVGGTFGVATSENSWALLLKLKVDIPYDPATSISNPEKVLSC